VIGSRLTAVDGFPFPLVMSVNPGFGGQSFIDSGFDEFFYNNIDIQLLSSGIYQAMITTVGGLIVGIMAYVMYNILVAKIEKLVFLLEARASDFMDVLNEPSN